jgi:hypothetical protein
MRVNQRNKLIHSSMIRRGGVKPELSSRNRPVSPSQAAADAEFAWFEELCSYGIREFEARQIAIAYGKALEGN